LGNSIMANLKLKNPSGGSLNFVSADGASDLTVTFPATTGTAMVSGNMPAFSAYPSADQTPSSATWTKVSPIDTEYFDTNNNFASSRFTPTVAGYYTIIAQLGHDYGSGHSAGVMGAAIYKNGSLYTWNRLTSGVDAYLFGIITCTALIYMNGSTDYVEMYGYNANPAPLFKSGTAGQTLFTGYLSRTT